MIYLVSSCVARYDSAEDISENYGPEWSKNNVDETNSPEFIYRTAEQLEGLPTSGEIYEISVTHFMFLQGC